MPSLFCTLHLVELHGGRKKLHIVSAILLHCLHQWQAADPTSLWEEPRLDGLPQGKAQKKSLSTQKKEEHFFLLKKGGFVMH